MDYLISGLFIIVSLIHLLPVVGMFGQNLLNKLYDIQCEDSNIEILMRHRAVLFGLLGLFLMIAAFQPHLHIMGLIAGFVSVISYLVISFSVGEYNAHLDRVFKADIVALICLIVALFAYMYGSVLRY